MYDSISDILDFPLPEIPLRRDKRQSQRNTTKDYHHSSLPTSYKIHKRNNENITNFPLQRTETESTLLGKSSESSTITNENMHYHNSHEKPKYLFGERTQQQLGAGEIFLNKSGWVQVNQRSFEKSPDRNEKKRFEYTKGLSVAGLSTIPITSARSMKFDDIKQQSYSHSKHDLRASALRSELTRQAFTKNSKIEELISRSEARRTNLSQKHSYSIDPQISAILNERPGFLPVTRLTDRDSPPPITPIISPPPAFQDSKAKIKSSQSIAKFHLTVNNHENRAQQLTQPHHNAKGMVFSRSFEYDNRKTRDYKENFSKSFDYDLSSTGISGVSDKMKSKMFTNLTGVSPNYLTKKESATRSKNNSRDASPVYQQQQQQQLQKSKDQSYVEQYKPKTRVRNTLSVRPEKFVSLDEQQGRSRRAQFSKLHHESSSSSGSQGFRSLDNTITVSAINRRLNSCDSGARSGEIFSLNNFFLKSG